MHYVHRVCNGQRVHDYKQKPNEITFSTDINKELLSKLLTKKQEMHSVESFVMYLMAKIRSADNKWVNFLFIIQYIGNPKKNTTHPAMNNKHPKIQ